MTVNKSCFHKGISKKHVRACGGESLEFVYQLVRLSYQSIFFLIDTTVAFKTVVTLLHD